jgi:ubiquinone/menaquinone biosynthesis C-methylase UbiE
MDTELREQADRYSLGHAPEEYERLRAQARVWEQATGRLLDHVGLGPDASCLDAGCGPGEVMRLMAQRVGPSGRVLGIDVDTRLGDTAQAALHRAGHRQCEFRGHDLNTDEPIPGAPFDLVYARLLLFHLPQRVAVLRRLWAAVAPGGHLIVQDYDLRGAGVLPELDSAEGLLEVVRTTMTAAGCDIYAGARLMPLFAQAGIGDPDGTDVTGRIEPLATGRVMLEATFRSVLPTALAHGITTETDAVATLAAFGRDAITSADRPVRWPLLIGAWKRKQQGGQDRELDDRWQGQRVGHLRSVE